jgi:putative N6-adenine-specific DNA methylase
MSMRAIRIAEANVKSAGLSKYIKLEVKPMQEIDEPKEPALVLFNPPYGERLVTEDLIGLYEMIGRTLKHKFSGNKAWIISSNIECLARIGLKPSRKINLLNGALPCEFRYYELFSGKRDTFLKDNNT